MSLLLALENALEKRIKYVIGNSAVVLSMAQNLLESGRVSENVNVVVKFAGSQMTRPRKGAHTAEVRVKNIDFEVIVHYKQSQREGYSFALALLDVISENINGYVPDLAPYLGENTQMIPAFQTGFELLSESAGISEDKTAIYTYTQRYSIQLGLPVVLASPISCPLEYNFVSLKDALPCKRCLKTAQGVITGLAEYTGNCFNGERIFVYDKKTCPPRPQDRLNITLGDELENNLYNVSIEFIPFEAISYDSEGEIVIDPGQIVTSNIERFFNDGNGNIPESCLDFTVIFRVYGDEGGTPPLESDVTGLYFIDDYEVDGII